jgi:hypothetical protein
MLMSRSGSGAAYRRWLPFRLWWRRRIDGADAAGDRCNLGSEVSDRGCIFCRGRRGWRRALGCCLITLVDRSDLEHLFDIMPR